MKLIFLDIDGVVNSALGRGPYISDMEIVKLQLLKRIIEDTHVSGVVITSDRRYSVIDMEDKLKAFKEYDIPVVGSLRLPNEDDLEDNRGKQINDYLSNNNNVTSILILDDNDDGISELFKDELLLVNRRYGINNDTYQKAIEILK